MPYSLPHLLGCALGAFIAGISIALIASPPHAPHDTFVETTSLASMGIGASKFEEVVQELAGAQELQYDELQYDQDASGTATKAPFCDGKGCTYPPGTTRAPTPPTPPPTKKPTNVPVNKPTKVPTLAPTPTPTLAPAVAVSTYDDTDVQTNVSNTATAQLTAWKANETNEKTAINAARATYAHACSMCACGACLSVSACVL